MLSHSQSPATSQQKTKLSLEIEKLNPQQREAVFATKGRVLILAGAGSGKTSALTLRMGHLIENCTISPKSILGLTFTNKAAAEMRQRVGQLINPKAARQITLSTFHSFCMGILREQIHHLGYTSQFSLYTEHDIERLVKLIARDILEQEGELPSLAPTLAAIVQAKNKGLKPHEISSSESEWHDNFVKTVYQRLHDSLRAYNAVDFDHLLWLTVELLESYPTILELYQDRFQYIMIDEYQDTNPIQYRLAALLSAKMGNLCVVGDDDQSIYGWRGAEVQHILHFEAQKMIKLEQNYRSTQHILEGANAVISRNQNRHSKTLWSDKGKGDLIQLFHAPKEQDEAEAIVYRILKWKESKKLTWKDFAILYRSNTLSRQIETALMKAQWQDEEGQWVRGIPYQIFGGTEFYERREIQDLFAYLRLIVNPFDQEAILRIINQPRRGIGEGFLDKLTGQNRREKIPLWNLCKDVSENAQNYTELLAHHSTKSFSGLQQFVNIIEEAKIRFKTGTLSEGMNWLIEALNYRKAIKEDVKSERMRDFKWENVEEFISTLAEFEQNPPGEIAPTLADFITSIPLQNKNEFSGSDKHKKNAVQLMTFHSAKGLEFPVCFLIGMEDHLIPHEKSLKETGIEEERRLMYVAMTRAKRILNISMARQRMRMGKEHPSIPSRFLFEIPKELIQITPWDQLGVSSRETGLDELD